MNLDRYYGPRMRQDQRVQGNLIDMSSQWHTNWLAEQPCIINNTSKKLLYGTFTKIDVHHQERRRGGRKNDFTGLPMTHDMHMEYHSIGHDSFERKYAVDMRDALIATLIERVHFLEDRFVEIRGNCP